MSEAEDLGFVWRERKDGGVELRHHGRLATTLRGAAAADFLAAMAGAAFGGQQQEMARVTGNYRRGNERTAAEHPRNRR